MITHDLESPFPTLTKRRIGACDYIVNCAAESHVDRSIAEPVSFIQNNVNVALTMLEFAREFPPEAFVQISTDEVYGPAPANTRHVEWSPIVPSNPYSASKACQEAIAIAYWRTYGVPVVITNTMNNFGEMQDPEKYIAKIIRLVSKGQVVPVHGTPRAKGSRFYLHARNHADAVLFILRRKPRAYKEGSDLFPDRYNVVGEKEVDNLSLAQNIARIMRKPLKYKLVDFHGMRPGHDRRYALSGAKLRKLGWKPPMSFQTSLKKYIAWTLKRKNLWL
jgi:dTDP-glucose 4,6-dehydratase